LEVQKRKQFFFEKKNQKTFAHWHTMPDKLSPIIKRFLLLFFKKEVLASLHFLATRLTTSKSFRRHPRFVPQKRACKEKLL